jgi:hypothetical protein
MFCQGSQHGQQSASPNSRPWPGPISAPRADRAASTVRLHLSTVSCQGCMTYTVHPTTSELSTFCRFEVRNFLERPPQIPGSVEVHRISLFRSRTPRRTSHIAHLPSKRIHAVLQKCSPATWLISPRRHGPDPATSHRTPGPHHNSQSGPLSYSTGQE